MLNAETGEHEDMVIWFVAFKDIDEWFAHGLSDEASQRVADDLASQIPGGEFMVLLALGGQTWDTIKPLAVQHASSQRELHHVIRESGQMGGLINKSEEELRALRAEWEDHGLDLNMN